MPNDSTRSQLRSKLRWSIFGIFALLLGTIFFDAPLFVNRGIDFLNTRVALGLPKIPDKPFALGLDLQGGAHLTYKANITGITRDQRGDAVQGVRDVIERRVNGLGVGEPNIQTSKVSEEYRVIVELPGVTDVKQAIDMIGATPILEFKEQNTTPPRELTKDEQAQIDTHNKAARVRAEALLKRVRDGEAYENVAKDSDDASSKNNGGYIGFVGSRQVEDSIYIWLANTTDGAVSTSSLIDTEAGYHILKRGKERDGAPQVTASHILICYLGAQSCDEPQYTKQEARDKAQELFDKANGDNFIALAKEFSTDKASASRGGDLGTFGRGAMVPSFEQAVFNAKVGEIVGPVETEFGYHVIYKRNEQPSKEYEFSTIFVRKQTALDILGPQDQWMSTGLSGKQLDRAEVMTDPTTGDIEVTLQFDNEGRELFRSITQKNVEKPVAIFLDRELISAPVVREPITDGRASISGAFSLAEARLLSQRLNAGALPVPVELISQQTVGATLGSKTLESSLVAGIIGIVIVMIFMIVYYRLPGLLSVVALSLYISLTLALFKLIGVTMTLAGIAGFILSIGMAVDANVLIFERLKEELKEKKSLKAGVEEGFLRAWTSIRDGNLSTLISCVLLIWFGSSFVKGFAVTLSIGILVSMFTAITVTWILLRFVVPWFNDRRSLLFLGFSKDTIKKSTVTRE